MIKISKSLEPRIFDANEVIYVELDEVKGAMERLRAELKELEI